MVVLFNRIEITASAFWRLLPQGMRRRWWLFRVLDGIARRWPVLGSRTGLLAIRMDGIGDMVLFQQSLEHYPEAFGVNFDEITVLGCDSWQAISKEVFPKVKVVTINEHKYARNAMYRLTVNVRVRLMAPAVTVADAYFRRALMSDSLAWVANTPRTVVAMPYINEKTRTEYRWYMSQGWEVIDTGIYPNHETYRHAAFISAVGDKIVAPETPTITWRDWDLPDGIKPPYAVLNPGSNEPGRRWPIQDYASLAKWLRAEGLRVVFVGKPGEKASDDALVPLRADEGVLDLTGHSTLPELLDIMKNAALVVSNDTGPAHVSIALGTNTVVIVGGGHFGCFVPYPEGIAPGHAQFVYERMECYHCFWRCDKRDNNYQSYPCVSAVRVEQVKAACLEFIGDKSDG